jgi:hypothetical protein
MVGAAVRACPSVHPLNQRHVRRINVDAAVREPGLADTALDPVFEVLPFWKFGVSVVRLANATKFGSDGLPAAGSSCVRSLVVIEGLRVSLDDVRRENRVEPNRLGCHRNFRRVLLVGIRRGLVFVFIVVAMPVLACDRTAAEDRGLDQIAARLLSKPWEGKLAGRKRPFAFGFRWIRRDDLDDCWCEAWVGDFLVRPKLHVLLGVELAVGRDPSQHRDLELGPLVKHLNPSDVLHDGSHNGEHGVLRAVRKVGSLEARMEVCRDEHRIGQEEGVALRHRRRKGTRKRIVTLGLEQHLQHGAVGNHRRLVALGQIGGDVETFEGGAGLLQLPSHRHVQRADVKLLLEDGLQARYFPDHRVIGGSEMLLARKIVRTVSHTALSGSCAPKVSFTHS